MSGGFWQEDSRSIFLAHVFNAIGVVPLGLAYAAGFALLWRHAEGALRLLVAPGRMALTNYLSHSLLGIALFYGVGLGLVGRLAPADPDTAVEWAAAISDETLRLETIRRLEKQPSGKAKEEP